MKKGSTCKSLQEKFTRFRQEIKIRKNLGSGAFDGNWLAAIMFFRMEILLS